MIIILDSTPLATDTRLLHMGSFVARRVQTDTFQVLKTSHGRTDDVGRIMDGMDLAGLMGEALFDEDRASTESALVAP